MTAHTGLTMARSSADGRALACQMEEKICPKMTLYGIWA